MVEQVVDCPGCGSPSRFVTPECPEHGDACPELACVLCGWALVLAVATVAGDGRTARSPTVDGWRTSA